MVLLSKSVGGGSGGPSERVVDDHRRVVRPSLVVGRRAVDRVAGDALRERGAGELVVDAPAGVVVERLTAPRPPGVRAVNLARVLAHDIHPAKPRSAVVRRVVLRTEDAIEVRALLRE